MANVGSILGGAFALLRERPGSVAIWGVTYCVGSVVLSLLMSLAMFGTLLPDPQLAAQPGAMMGPGFGFALLLYLGMMLLGVVLINAVFRAMLRPEEGGFASMRLGMDELRMFGLVLLLLIAVFAAVLIGELALFLLIGLVNLVLGAGVVTAILSFVLFLAFLCAVIWIEVRISLILPLSFYRRRITVDGAWALTRGRFWTLFGAYFLVALIFVLVGGIFLWATMGGYFVALAQAGRDPAQMQAAMEAFAAQQYAMPLATRALYVVVGAVFYAIALAMGPGLLASATRELLGDDGDEAAVFAAESDGSIMD